MVRQILLRQSQHLNGRDTFPIAKLGYSVNERESHSARLSYLTPSSLHPRLRLRPGSAARIVIALRLPPCREHNSIVPHPNGHNRATPVASDPRSQSPQPTTYSSWPPPPNDRTCYLPVGRSVATLRTMRKGIPVSPGVAVGIAYCIHEIFVDPDTQRLEDQEVTAELAQYEAARERAAADLRALQSKVQSQVGHDEAAIFGVHESILRDASFSEKIRTWISKDRLSARAALHRLLNEYTSLFARTKDEYLRERLNDVRDVVVRLNSHLSHVAQPGRVNPLQGPLIIVADELLPSQVVALGDMDVKGIVTQAGSQTSHAAILARSRGIPAVSGVPGILRQVNTGDTIVVDGRDGHVTVNPDAETRAAYRKLEREFFHLKDELAANRDQPAVTADGVELEFLANINNVADVQAAKAMGAAGIGLFRTEYLYLTHPDVPDEEEQLKTYRAIIAATPRHHVTIRTLDIGGDKTVPYLGTTTRKPILSWAGGAFGCRSSTRSCS